MVVLAYDRIMIRLCIGKWCFLIGGRLREMVTHERWSHMQV